MKKLTVFLTIIITSIIMMCGGMSAFAGDVPESLTESKAQVYFGRIEKMGNSSEVNGFEVYDYIEVMPVEAIKDNVTQGEKIRYNMVEYNFHYKGKPQSDEIYLFAYYDENNPLECFCVTAYDTDTLRIVGVNPNDENNMWFRFQKYLNEGKYGKAKIEGITPKSYEAYEEKMNAERKRSEFFNNSEKLLFEKSSTILRFWWIGVIIITAVIVLAVKTIRKRHKKS